MNKLCKTCKHAPALYLKDISLLVLPFGFNPDWSGVKQAKAHGTCLHSRAGITGKFRGKPRVLAPILCERNEKSLEKIDRLTTACEQMAICPGFNSKSVIKIFLSSPNQ